MSLSINQIVNSHNVAELLDEDKLVGIGQRAIDGYRRDLQSRSQWDERNADSFKLALQVKENKTYPWVGASNVKFPLITVAAMQFHARAYPATVPSNGLVKAAVYGPDPDGSNFKRSNRVGAHMTWQLMEEAPEWEENHDKMLLTLAIVGTVFKKTYFDPIEGRNKHDLIMPKDLVVDYFAKSLEDAHRVTHVVQVSSNTIRERVVRGIYLDLGESPKSMNQTLTQMDYAKDDAQGTQRPYDQEGMPTTLLEQHTWLDLDEDGYAEPYVVTLREADNKVLRIVARYIDQGDVIRVNDDRIKNTDDPKEKLRLRSDKKNHIVRIIPTRYFTKYSFIPSPDGGFYDLGLGSLLGPINQSVDTAINQLIDAGTMNNLGGGFLGPGVSIKAGVMEREPGSWIPINGRGDDVRKNLIPFPQTPPSPILLQLLELLISYGERISGSTELMGGVAPGQNTPAETSRNTIEQGMKVFSAIYKRIYRAMKQEFKLVYDLNRIYLDKEQFFRDVTNGQTAMVQQDDYLHNQVNVVPAADPNMASDSQKLMQAQAVLEFSKAMPGVNIHEAGLRYLEALKVHGIEAVYPDPKGPNAIPPQPNVMLQVEQMKVQAKQMDAQVKMKVAAMKIMAEQEHTMAKIENLRAQAMLAMKQADGIDVKHELEMLNIQIAASKEHHDQMKGVVEMLHQHSMDMLPEPQAKVADANK